MRKLVCRVCFIYLLFYFLFFKYSRVKETERSQVEWSNYNACAFCVWKFGGHFLLLWLCNDFSYDLGDDICSVCRWYDARIRNPIWTFCVGMMCAMWKILEKCLLLLPLLNFQIIFRNLCSYCYAIRVRVCLCVRVWCSVHCWLSSNRLFYWKLFCVCWQSASIDRSSSLLCTRVFAIRIQNIRIWNSEFGEFNFICWLR